MWYHSGAEKDVFMCVLFVDRLGTLVFYGISVPFDF